MTWDEQGRPYFECGRCSRRVKHIYVDELVCRRCAGLDYASRHLHRSVPGVHRVTRWRRQIGIDPHPFAAIPERPKHHTRFHRIAARIRVEESELVGHLYTPQTATLQIIEAEAPRETSTERLRAAIDRIRGKTHQHDLPATDQDDPPSTH